MEPFSQRLELRCQQCGKSESYTVGDLWDRLRAKGFLRRQEEPSAELVQEIVRSCVADGLWEPCTNCGAVRPVPAFAPNEAAVADPAWGDTIYCEVCKTVIPPERLELFPNSRQCVSCQRKLENGTNAKDAEYCPHCGDILQTKLVSRGVSSYRQYCPSCRKTY